MFSEIILAAVIEGGMLKSFKENPSNRKMIIYYYGDKYNVLLSTMTNWNDEIKLSWVSEVQTF